MLLAIGNGIVREATYGRFLSDLHAHQVSTAIAIAIFGVSVILLAKHLILGSSLQALVVGIIWLALTICFEFLFGRYVAGHSWSQLFQDYVLSSGRVGPLLLAWVTFLPYIAYKSYEPAT